MIVDHIGDSQFRCEYGTFTYFTTAGPPPELAAFDVCLPFTHGNMTEWMVGDRMYLEVDLGGSVLTYRIERAYSTLGGTCWRESFNVGTLLRGATLDG